MKSPVSNNTNRNKKIYLINMAFGVMVSIIALYLVITGEYSNLAERKEVESTLNMISLLGFLYATGAWYGYIFFTPASKD